MAVRRGRRRKQLLDGLTERRGYWELEEEALDRSLWRTHFERGYGHVRQTTEWIEYTSMKNCTFHYDVDRDKSLCQH
jgi:hypothetical protein